MNQTPDQAAQRLALDAASLLRALEAEAEARVVARGTTPSDNGLSVKWRVMQDALSRGATLHADVTLNGKNTVHTVALPQCRSRDHIASSVRSALRDISREVVERALLSDLNTDADFFREITDASR